MDLFLAERICSVCKDMCIILYFDLNNESITFYTIYVFFSPSLAYRKIAHGATGHVQNSLSVENDLTLC